MSLFSWKKVRVLKRGEMVIERDFYYQLLQNTIRYNRLLEALRRPAKRDMLSSDGFLAELFPDGLPELSEAISKE